MKLKLKRKKNPHPVPVADIHVLSVSLDPLSMRKLRYLQSFYLDYLKVPAYVSSIVRRALDGLIKDASVCIDSARESLKVGRVSMESAEKAKMAFHDWLYPVPENVPEAVKAIDKHGLGVTFDEAIAMLGHTQATTVAPNGRKDERTV